MKGLHLKYNTNIRSSSLTEYMGINLFLNTFQFDVTKIYFKILTQCTNSRFDILYDKTLYLEIEKHVL